MTQRNCPYTLGLSLMPNFGIAKFKQMLSKLKTAKNIWEASPDDFMEVGLTEKYANHFIGEKSKINLEKELAKLEKENVFILSIEDPSFPKELRDIHSAPIAIFCKGDLEILERKKIAIVGTRKPTAYGEQAAGKFASEFGELGFAITSGMAQGIDSIAHQSALDGSIPTIAVLASGLDEHNILYGTNRQLAKNIIDRGLLISEYAPGIPANKFNFPARNRIVSGLSLATIVIEAGEKSGTLITANFALEQGRDVFAVPGSIFSSQSLGTNKLISQGAQLALSTSDMLSQIGVLTTKTISELEFSDQLEENIFKIISDEAACMDVIAKKLNIGIGELSAKLSFMEIRGLIKSAGDGSFLPS